MCQLLTWRAGGGHANATTTHETTERMRNRRRRAVASRLTAPALRQPGPLSLPHGRLPPLPAPPRAPPPAPPAPKPWLRSPRARRAAGREASASAPPLPRDAAAVAERELLLAGDRVVPGAAGTAAGERVRGARVLPALLLGGGGPPRLLLPPRAHGRRLRALRRAPRRRLRGPRWGWRRRRAPRARGHGVRDPRCHARCGADVPRVGLRRQPPAQRHGGV